MFNRFIKKSSKFFAVLLTATLAFTPLSYGATPATFTDLGIAISDGTVSPQVITINDNIDADVTGESLGEQGADELTIDGSGKNINANNSNSGFGITSDKTTTVNNVSFENFNKDGDGAVIYNHKGNLTVNQSSFSYNQATGKGGAIRHKADEVGSLSITNSSFTANKASIAGAVMIEGGNTSFENSSFKNNEAETVGALAIFHSNPGEITTLSNVIFEENKSTSAASGYAGAVALGSAVDVRVDASKFIKNEAAVDGGAITNFDILGSGDLSNGALSITNSEFVENKAAGNGGAIDNYFYRSGEDNHTDTVYINNTKFQGNEAANGGAIYNHSAEEGDGTAPTMLIENSTFTANKANQYGGAIYNAGTMTINNSSFTANTTIGETTASNDIYNVGDLSFLSGETFLEGGIAGAGETIISGATVNFDKNAKFEQDSIIIEEGSLVIVNAANVNITGINDILYNRGSLVLYSTTTDIIDFANPIMDVVTSGTTTITSGTNINMGDKYLQQYGLTIEEDAVLVVNSSVLNIEDEVENEGDLIFESEIGDEMINENDISGNGKLFVFGDLTNKSEINQSSVTISDAEVINEGIIKSTDVVINEGATLIAKGEIDTYGDGEFENGKITNNGTFTVNVLNDEGEPDTVPNFNTIIGTGELRISSTNFIVQENARIEQGSVVIEDEDSSLSVDVSSITVSPDGSVQNAGKFILTGEGINNNAIEGYEDSYGETVFAEGSEIVNNAQIDQSTVTVLGTVANDAEIMADNIIVNENGSLITDADDLVAFEQIENNNDLTFVGGVNKNVIVGTGTLTIDGTVINGNAESTEPMITVSQSTVTVSGGSLLSNVGEITTNYLTGEGTVENETKLILNLLDDAGYDLANLRGVGVSSITVEAGKTVTLNNTGTIEQSKIETYGAGTLILAGNDIVADVVNYMTGNSLDIETRIVGSLDNNPGNEETQGIVNILDGGSVSGLITNSTGTVSIYTNFEVETGITSNNTSDISKNIINIGSATAAGIVISSQTIEYQTINISSGSLTMNSGNVDGTIKDSSITVATDGLLSVKADNLVNISNPITNNGIVDLYGYNVVNVSTITGNGELQINGSITNQEGTKINQSTVTISEGNSLVANASDITTTGKGIVNNGSLVFTTESGDAMINTSTITKTTELAYLTIDKGILENTADIEQSDIYVSEEGQLGNNEGTTIKATYTLTNDNVIENEGNIEASYFENNWEFGNKGNTTVTDLYNRGSIENETDSESAAIITAVNLINDSEYPDDQAEIYNYEDSIILAGTIISSGTITNAGLITSTVTFTNYGSVLNSSGVIAAKDFVNEENATVDNRADAGIIATGTLTNKGMVTSSGTIAAETLANSGTIISSGSIVAQDIQNNSLDALIENKEGATIEAETLTNSGTILSSGSITVADVINNNEGALIESYGTSESGTYEGATIEATEIKNAGTLTANASGVNAVVSNAATGIYNITGGTVSYNVGGAASGGSVVNISNEVTVDSETYISQNRINTLEDSVLILEDESSLKTSDLYVGNNSTLNTQNDGTYNILFHELHILDGVTWTWNLDIDLEKGLGDQLTNIKTADGKVNIIDIKLLSDKAYQTPDIQIGEDKLLDIVRDENDVIGIFATEEVSYKIKLDTSRTDSTWLLISNNGYGGLPGAVYDGARAYSLTMSDYTDKVVEWIDGHNTLIEDMIIHGGDGTNTIKAETESGDPLIGINTDSYRLEIENLAGFAGFENALTVGQDGELIVRDVTFSENTGDAVITNNGVTTLSGVTFDNTNTAYVDVFNNGELLLTTSSTTFNNGIVGQDGTTIIKGVGIDMGDATLAQKLVEISHVEGSSLTVKVDNLQYERGSDVVATELILNNGELYLLGNEGDASVLSTRINGVGTTTVSGGAVTVDEETKITQKTVSIVEGSTLTANANNIDTFAKEGSIENAGALEFNGGTNNNTINGAGDLIISGDVTNADGAKVTQSTVTVNAEKSLTANASDIVTTGDGIINDGTLTFNGGVNTSTITTNGQGQLVIAGQVVNEENTKVTQSSITVNAGASLTANASDLAAEEVANAGDLVFVGSDMVNTSTITGTGNLTVKADLQNNSSIEQTNIDILAGTFEHNATDDFFPVISAADITISSSATLIAHSEIVASDKITNNGLFEVNVESEEEYTPGDETVKSANVIEGTGEFKLTKTTYANEKEGTKGSIKQSTITISDAESVLVSDVNNVTATEKVQNAGVFVLNGEGINKNVIDGYEGTNGELVIDGTIENYIGKTITQSTITVNAGKSFTTSADDITTTGDGIINNGTLTFNGGVNTSTITFNADDGELALNINKDVENTAFIAQKAITVADNTVFVTEAADLLDIEDVEQTITLGQDAKLNFIDNDESADATLTANITGNGFIVKEGEGKVILTGTNDYTGVTTISAGSIEISSSTNISENTIFMDGGKLVVNTETNDVELGNKIVGTYGVTGTINDVEIEVTGVGTSTLTSTSQIYGHGNLIKDGEGTLDLRMESNEYIGDTNILNGKLVGTTANILGTIFGSGDDSSAVEFYDAEGDVILNELSLEDYIGTFDKTGAASMTVVNDFKALNANITNGTFIINNDEEMGSGKTFEVTDTMLVENALLKGCGNTEVGTLVIGKGATFAPGNSTTTWNQSGNLAFEEDGEYDVEFGQFDMDTEGHYNDNTAVSGTTTIGDDAKITLNNLEGKYYVWETIDLINSGTLADGYEYQEDNVVFNDNDARDLRPGYDTRISTRVYTEGNALKLELQRKQSEYSDAIEFDRSHNEQEAANAIDAISTGNGGDITNPLDAMEKMYYYQETYDIEGLQAALNDIAGVIHANSTMLTFTNAKIEHVYDKIKERTKDLFPCTKFHDKIWAEYYYNTYKVDKNENSHKFDTSVNGFLVGFDMISAKQWTMGVMAGYGTSELKQEQDKTTMRDINLGFYGGFENDKWLLKGMLLGGYEQYATDRTIGFMDRMANSEHNGYSAALDLEAGYKISLNKKDSKAKHKMYLKPFLGITGSYINNEGYEEKNAESLNLKINDYSNFAAQARAGVGINGKVKKFGWYAKAGVRQFLTEDYNEIESSLLDYQDQTKMKIRSAELDKFSYGGGLGADFALSDAWTIFANGLASFADKSNNYYGNIGLMYKFGCVNNEKKTDEDMEKMSAMLNEKITEEEALKKELADKEKELNDAKNREKELQDRIQKYEANIVSAEEAQKMKQKTIKTLRLGEKPTFVFGTDQLNKNGQESLKQVATELEAYPDAELLVEGHTDNIGGDEINQQISEKRASKVATTLKKDYGVKNNISVIGKGKTEPIASNDTAEGRAKNRRVEVIVTTAE